MLVAAAATIATSPPREPVGEIGANGKQSAELNAETPKATGEMVLELNGAALPSQPQDSDTVEGEIMFVASDASGALMGPASVPMKLDVTAVGLPQPPRRSSERQLSWPIEELCRVAEPCKRTFSFTVEWLRPAPGDSYDVQVSAILALRYPGQSSAPAGAQATIRASGLHAIAAGPALHATTDLGEVRLAQDAPFAARHLVVRASAEALAQAAGADASGLLKIESPGAGPAVALTVIDDRKPHASHGPGEILGLFEGCEARRPCERGFTVAAQWTGARKDGQLALQWSFESVIRFTKSSSVPRNARLSVEIDSRAAVDAESPRVTATSSGTLPLTSVQGRARGTTTLVVTGPPRSGAFLGARPPAIAELTLTVTRGAASAPSTVSLSVAVDRWSSVEPPRQYTVTADGPPLRVALAPLASCPPQPDKCAGTIQIGAGSKDIPPPTITWELSVEIAYPGGVPPDARIEIEQRGTS